MGVARFLKATNLLLGGQDSLTNIINPQIENTVQHVDPCDPQKQKKIFPAISPDPILNTTRAQLYNNTYS